MTRQIKINLEQEEFNSLEKIKNISGLTWERLIKDSIEEYSKRRKNE